MISPTLKFRVLILAVLPTTAVSIFFFSYFVSKQIDDIEKNIVDNGKTLAKHLATASEYGIFSGNMGFLSPLVESAFTNHDVVSITITNREGIPLIQKSLKNNEPKANVWEKGAHNRVFSQPVIQHAIDINDFEDTEVAIPPVIGWVVVEVSNQTALKNKREAILQALSVTVLTLIISIFLATRISRNISEPISSLTNAVNEIENGNLDVDIETHPTGALFSLEQGVRSMLQSIKSSHQEAQQKIEQATRELRDSLELLEQQNTELTITRQQALAASKAKSAFLTNISHEIRTPMNGILGFVKLLKNTNPTPEQEDYLYTIEQSANNLLTIINDVLDFAKIEAGKLSISNVPFNLERCIEDVLILVAPSAHEKGIEISSLFYDDTPRELIGAVDRIRQVLINLVGNAVKFSEHGTVMVRAMLDFRREDTLCIKISITDQGPGISEKDKRLLFNAFSQVDSSNTRQYGGAGLGLAICKSLTEAMHGNIGVESRKGEGSTFWFTFTCQSADNREVRDIGDTPHWINKTLILYDNNELTRNALLHTFRHKGFSIHECLELEDINALVDSTNPPDLCVLSINQDEARHTHLHDFLCTQRTNGNIPILVLVSSSESAILGTLREHGASACLSKPFRDTELNKALDNILNEKVFDQQMQTKAAEDNQAHTRLDNLHILIAEDNAINAKLIDTIMQRAGATSLVVKNGREAIEALSQRHFDIVLMDIHMPEMNGIDAARGIRELDDPVSSIPIIGLTAVSQTKDAMLYQNRDFNEILEKPIAVDELLHEISYWVYASASANIKPGRGTQTGKNLGIDTPLANTLNEMLFRELPECKKKLQTAFSDNNHASLREELHRLLGGLAYCDFETLQKKTLDYQASLKSDGTQTGRGDERKFRQLIAEIDAVLAANKATSKH
ncbi:MAG TPA: response regulator [Gammaproteobacteria bacterium]|nr:response regulator [Gammaproteobacteria bacterium]